LEPLHGVTFACYQLVVVSYVIKAAPPNMAATAQGRQQQQRRRRRQQLHQHQQQQQHHLHLRQHLLSLRPSHTLADLIDGTHIAISLLAGAESCHSSSPLYHHNPPRCVARKMPCHSGGGGEEGAPKHPCPSVFGILRPTLPLAAQSTGCRACLCVVRACVRAFVYACVWFFGILVSCGCPHTQACALVQQTSVCWLALSLVAGFSLRRLRIRLRAPTAARRPPRPPSRRGPTALAPPSCTAAVQ
jgi:hypothetical protein